MKLIRYQIKYFSNENVPTWGPSLLDMGLKGQPPPATLLHPPHQIILTKSKMFSLRPQTILAAGQIFTLTSLFSLLDMTSAVSLSGAPPIKFKPYFHFPFSSSQISVLSSPSHGCVNPS